MKFSKWGGWRAGWTFEFLPRISYRPKSVSYGYQTDGETRQRTGPVIRYEGMTLQLGWLWCVLTLKWEDSRELTPEETLEYDSKP